MKHPPPALRNSAGTSAAGYLQHIRSGMVTFFGAVSCISRSRCDAAGVWGIGVGPTPLGAEFRELTSAAHVLFLWS